MKRLYWMLMLLAPLSAAADSGFGGWIAVQSVGAQVSVRSSFAVPVEIKQLLKQAAPDTIVAMPSGDSDHVLAGMYRGSYVNERGESVFEFDSLQEVSKDDVARLREAPAGKDGSAGLVLDHKPEAEAPGSGGTGLGQGAGQGSGPGNGSGSGLGKAFGDAGQAGAGAAIATGVANGLVNTPGVRREMRALQDKLDQAAQAANAQRGAWQQEQGQYNESMGQAVDQFAREASQFRPLAAPTPAQRSAFAKTPAGTIVTEVRGELANFQPATEREQNLADISNAAANAAESAYQGGQDPLRYAKIASTFAEVALGLNPATALVSDGYGFLTGKSIVNGRTLSGMERTLAGAGFALGLATAGAGSSLVEGIQVAGKLMQEYGHLALPALRELEAFGYYARSLGFQTAAGVRNLVYFTRTTLGNEIGAIGRVSELVERQAAHLGQWAEAYDLRRIYSADELNAKIIAQNPAFRAPYLPGTQVFEVVAKNDMKFLRFHGANNQVGSWVVRVEALDHTLTPAQLRLKYSLPFTPEFVSEVKVPAGTQLWRSKVNSNFGGGARAIQYEIRDARGVKFGRPRPLSN